MQNVTSDGGYNIVMLIHDGDIVQKGVVTLGNVTPDPVHAPASLSDYVNVYHLTLTWLDSFATKNHPVDILNPVWGQTGIYGEVSIGSIGMQNVTVPGGNFYATTLHFHDSGVDSYLWVAPSLAFPVKAKVYAIKTSGAPTIGYQYQLLEKGNSPTPPSFLNVKTTNPLGGSSNCPVVDYANDKIHTTQATDTGAIGIEYYYSPRVPHQGCPIGWRISFEPVYDALHKISDIHYDIFTVDAQGHEISSLAQNLGRTDIYSAVGDDEQVFLEKNPPPVAHYVIYVAGTGPESGVTDVSKAGLIKVDVKVAPPLASTPSTSTPSSTGGGNTSGLVNNTSSSQVNGAGSNPPIVIPSWIKNNAKWWSEGQMDDSQFEKGMQYLIQKGIMKVPKTTVSSAASHGIPSWVKKNAGWWASGQISDTEFVKGIQYMITNGMISINS